MTTRYWVVGGEYRDTDFAELAPGAQEERHGPYPDYAAAHAAWFALARATIDDATVRYRIVEDEGGAA